MGSYNSKHTGLRVDNAVDKIPATNPTIPNSLIMVSGGTDGGSGRYTSLDNNSIIEKNDKIQLKQEYIDYLDGVTYKKPTMTLSITPSTTNYKLPATYTLTSFRHSETNLGNISGKLMFKRGTFTLKSDIQPASTSTTVSISDGPITLTTSGLQYMLIGVDTKGNSITSSVRINAYYTSYYGASSVENISDTVINSLTDNNSSSLKGTINVTVSGTSQYVWFVSTTAISSIKSGGFDVPYELVNDSYSYNGGSYKCYRTSEKVIVGANTFVVE